MRKEDMVCSKCIKFDGARCRASPEPLVIAYPDEHWCGQGQWHEPKGRYEEIYPFVWGDWED